MDLDTPTVDPSADKGSAKTDNQSITDISQGLAIEQRKKISGLETIQKENDSVLKSDLASARRARDQMGFMPGEDKPWNAEAESDKRRTDPVMAFGSLGSIFGILASAFTHAPMANAMNASAAAINAMREGNEQDYQRAYRAWQDNTKLAIERNRIQQEKYQDAIDLMKTNMALGAQRFSIAATMYDDKQVLHLMETGNYKPAIDLVASRHDLATKIDEDMLRLDMDHIKRNDLLSRNYKVAKPGGPPLTPAEIQNNIKVLREWNADWSPAKIDWVKEQINAVFSNTNLSDDEKLRQTTAIMQASKGGPTIAQQAGKAIEEKVTNAPEGTPRMEAVKEAQTKNIGASPSLSDESLDLMADQYIAGDKSVFQNLGRQAQGAANIVALRDRVTKKVLDQGVTGPELATRMAEFSGMLAAQRTLGVRTANVELFNNEALKMMDVAETQSHKFERTNFPAINRALQAWESNTGDPGIRAFGASINSLVNAYAKAIQGGGQATVSDKEHAREILSTADTSEQFDAVISVLKAELQAARQAPGAVKQELRDLSSGGSTIDKGKVPQPKGVIRYDNQGNRINE